MRRRWVRVCFGREFPLDDLLILWDGVFAEGQDLHAIAYTCVAMLMFVRNKLTAGDYIDCMKLLQDFPPMGDVRMLLDIARRLRDPEGAPTTTYSAPAEGLKKQQQPRRPAGAGGGKAGRGTGRPLGEGRAGGAAQAGPAPAAKPAAATPSARPRAQHPGAEVAVAAGAGSGGAAARPRQGLAPGAAPSESARLRVRMKSAGCQLSAILAELEAAAPAGGSVGSGGGRVLRAEQLARLKEIKTQLLDGDETDDEEPVE